MEGLKAVKSRVDSNLPRRSASKTPRPHNKDKKEIDTPLQWTAKLGEPANTSAANRPPEIKMTLLRRPPEAVPSSSAEFTGVKYPVPDAFSVNTPLDKKITQRTRGRPKGTLKTEELCDDQP